MARMDIPHEHSRGRIEAGHALTETSFDYTFGQSLLSFDVRNDSDALYTQFGISMAGIHSIQLMELATRTFSKRCVNGLSGCIDRDAAMTSSKEIIWTSVKEKGLKLFAPEHGASYEVSNIRRLAEEVRAYCVLLLQTYSAMDFESR